MSARLRGRSRRALTAVLAFTLALSAAGGVTACGEAAPPPEPVSLSLAISREAMSAIAYVARDHGLFTSNGLDVTLIESSSSQVGLQALLDAEVDAALVADTPIALSALDGKPVRIIATVATATNDLRIVARSDAGIQTPEDLRGKRIGTRYGTAAHFFLHGFLIKYGMSEAGVDVHFDTYENLTSALVEGRLDAVAVRQPFIADLEDALGERFVSFEAPGLYDKTMNLCVSTDRPPDADVQQRLLRSLLDAEQHALSLGTEAVRADVAADIGVDTDDLRDAVVVAEAVGLRQSLIMTLEDQARWAVAIGASRSRGSFDFLRLLDTRALDAVAPERVTVIR